MNSHHHDSMSRGRLGMERAARVTVLLVCAVAVACAKRSEEPSAFPGVSGDASSAIETDDLSELSALEARLAGLRGELDRSTYLAQAPGDRSFEARVESADVRSDEAERAGSKRGSTTGAARDRVSRREQKSKKDGAASGGGVAPSAPPQENAKMGDTSGEAEGVAEEEVASIAGGDDAPAGAAAAPASSVSLADETETCPKVCSLSESICELTDRVCSLASRHAGEPRFEAACGRAKTDCTDAVAACTACTVGE